MIPGTQIELTKIPDSARCETCNFFDISHAAVIARLGELRMALSIAACRCAQNAERGAERLRLMVQEANLPNRGCTFQNFVIREGAGIREARNAALDFAANFGPPILVFVGGTGTGKSHLLEAIGRKYLSFAKGVRFDTAAHFVDRFRFASSPASPEEPYPLMQYYASFYTVLLDDLGAEAPRSRGKLTEGQVDFATEKITSLIEDRINNGGRLAIATNLTKDEVEDQYGVRLASRVFDKSDRDRTLVLGIDASDYRKGTQRSR